MSTKTRKHFFSKKNTTLFEQEMNEFSRKRNGKNPITAENINLILERNFMKLELLKYNLFGEDFENYGNIVINGQTYCPNKLNLEYLANQSKDIAREDFNANMEIITSLKNAASHKINTNNTRNKKKEGKKTMYNTDFKKMFKNKSCQNIYSQNSKFKLPTIKSNFNETSNNLKLFFQRSFYPSILSYNKKIIEAKKNDFLKRHKWEKGIKFKLSRLENHLNHIGKEITNDQIINESKVPHFQYRYKYLDSKFNV